MKKPVFIILSFMTVLFARELSIGKVMPKVNIPIQDVNGETFTLKKLMDKNGLLVIFSCNTCPWVIRWQDRYNPIAGLCSENNIGFVAVNSNARQHNGVDSYKAMQEHAREYNYKFPYVMDKRAELANAFGAKKTPHVYLFNKDNKLVYRGAIDDNAENAENVTTSYLVNAVNAVAMGEEIKVKKTKALGCSIKF